MNKELCLLCDNKSREGLLLYKECSNRVKIDSIDIIENKITELQNQLKECSSDWAYWDIQQELKYWTEKLK